MVDKKETKKVSKNSKMNKIEYIPSLITLFNKEVKSDLMKSFSYSNVMEIPKLISISINMGIGDAKNNAKDLESAVDELTLISGQKPIITMAKQDISNFKIRKGWPVGCKVTLRSNRMYEFLERLISIALPRTRDFRGLPHKSFDGRGNYNFGIKEQIIFTEIDYDKIQSIRGMNVTMVTSAKTDNEAYALLKNLGLPLRERPVKKGIEEVV